MSRKAISKRLRFEVFKRDGFTCQYCGATPNETVILHCDHIHPVALGGETDMDNLVTSCASCNLGKSAVPLSAVPVSLAERAAEVAEQEEQIAGYQAAHRSKRDRIEDNAREVLERFCENYGQDYIPRKDFSSIKIFIQRGSLEDALEAADIAHSKFPWSYKKGFLYFCGVCWRKIRRAEGTEE